MTATGWIVMIIACGGTTAAFAWCLARVLAPRERDRVHGPADVVPGDQREP
ncbi:MAG: hypothetical protein RLZZ127_2293 [Planctomycetota bacterium]